MRAAFSMAIYREPGVLPHMTKRVLTGAAIVLLQFVALHYVDRFKVSHPDALGSGYVWDALVFWATLVPCILVVAGALFAARFVYLVSEASKGLDIGKMAAKGLGIAQDMRRWYEARDETKCFASVKAAQHWIRVEVPLALAGNAKLKTAFDGVQVNLVPYASEWQSVRDWLPAVERDAARLREAVVVLEHERNLPA